MSSVAISSEFHRNHQMAHQEAKLFRYDGGKSNNMPKTDITHPNTESISTRYQQTLKQNPSVFHKKTSMHIVPQSVPSSKVFSTSTRSSESCNDYMSTLVANRRDPLAKNILVQGDKRAGFYSPQYSSFKNFENLKKKNFKNYEQSLVGDPEHAFSLSDCLESAREIYRESKENIEDTRDLMLHLTPRGYTPRLSARSSSAHSLYGAPSTNSRPVTRASPRSASYKTGVSRVTSALSSSSSHKSTVRMLRNIYDQQQFEEDIQLEERERRRIEQVKEKEQKLSLFNPAKLMEEIDNFETRNNLRSHVHHL